MANRRMFSKEIVDTDRFLDMSSSARLLYYDLGMRADDDGFLQDARKIIRITGASWGDMQVLIERGFVIPFESGVVVIRHWRNNNQIRADRYKPTICTEEKALLTLSQGGSYERLPTGCQLVANRETQKRLGKDSLKEEARARAREALPAAPDPAADEGCDLADRIDAHRRADNLIQRYQLPDADPTREALLEDAERKGWQALEEALRQASNSNSRQRISVNFYRSILYPNARKEGAHVQHFSSI